MIREYLLSLPDKRAPDFIVGGKDNPYLLRWWIIPRNPIFNIYLHLFMRSDDDRALHDHPWLFNLSWLIEGWYTEHTKRGARVLQQGRVKLRLGPAPHRIELTHGACFTLFVTGPRVREWGFLCSKGWIPWFEFVSDTDRGSVGRGCGE